MEEEWKDIYFKENGIVYDFRNLYQVSNLGRIKSLNYMNTGKEKILKLNENKCGNDRIYLRIYLYKNGTQKRFLVHRLVAHMFIEGYFNGAEIDHINTIPNDNRAENLKWCTRTENMNNNLTKEKSKKANLKEKNPRYGKGRNIIQEDLNGNLIKIWNSLCDICENTGINSSSIIRCCQFQKMNCDKEEWLKTHKNRPCKSAGGYIWKYYEEDDID